MQKQEFEKRTQFLSEADREHYAETNNQIVDSRARLSLANVEIKRLRGALRS